MGITNLNHFVFDLEEPSLKPYQSANPPLKSLPVTRHEAGKTLHEVENFEVYLNRQPDVILKWGFCKECDAIRYKEVVGYEEKTQTAHIRTFIKNGKKYDHTTKD